MEYQILKSRLPVIRLLFGLAITLFAGCDKLAVDVDPPKVSPKLVLFAFLSPDEPWVKVEVSQSKPVFGRQTSGTVSGYLPDAKVTIVNANGQTANLNFDDSAEAYFVNQSVFAIEAGQTYTITAERGGEVVTGKTTVPLLKPQFTEVNVRNIFIPNPNGSYFGPVYIYTYKWLDEPLVGNYYRVSIDKKTYSYNYQGRGDLDSSLVYYNICNSLWEDANQNGQQFTGTCEDYSYYGEEGDTLDFSLLNTDIHYAEYHKRRLIYYGEDPFTEPFPQYSNVSTGLGVVCSYRKSIQRVFVK